MSDRLKPCPFCGGEASMYASNGALAESPLAGGTRHVECDNCFASGPAEGAPRDGSAWNQRRVRPEIIEAVEDAFKDAYNEHGAQGYGRDKLSQHAVTEALAELEGKIMFLLNSAHLTAGATHDR